jgi:DNA-binding MarR family transcriptional regulator
MVGQRRTTKISLATYLTPSRTTDSVVVNYSYMNYLGGMMTDSLGPVRTGRESEQEFPVYDHEARECVLNLSRAHQLVWPIFEGYFRRFGLSAGAFNVLMILRSAEAPLPPYVIGERILVTRSAVTAILTTLEARGFITRETHPTDRRMFLIEITQQGWDHVQQMLPGLFRLEHEAFACLTKDEKETLIRLLGKVQAHASTIANSGFGH